MEEVAAAALYRAVEATFTTGVELTVDAGSARASAPDGPGPVGARPPDGRARTHGSITYGRAR
ncbi:hypothetical protein ACWF2L_00530 [Streptomyces anulatus]